MAGLQEVIERDEHAPVANDAAIGRPVDQLMQSLGYDEDEISGDERRLEAVSSNLAAHVRRCWNAARLAKEPIERRMLQALRQRQGKYDHDRLAEIREQGGSEIFMQVTQVKVRAAKSWIREILFPPGDKAWGIEPTPMAELPRAIHQAIEQEAGQRAQQAIMMGMYVDVREIQERIEQVKEVVKQRVQGDAKLRAERMERYIEDICAEGKWRQELEDFLDDFITHPAAVFKGPTTVMRKQLEWQGDTYEVKPHVERKPLRIYKRVSPFDIYPAPDARSLQDGYLIERMKLRRKDLYDLIGVDGYDETGIREALRQYGETGLDLHLTNDTERDRLEGREHDDWSKDTTIDVINYWGHTRGQALLEWGMTEEEIPDPDDDYEANIMLVGEHVIRAALNPHPLGERPYNSASFERANDQIWGRGLPEIIRDIQNMCNAAARSLANNMALSSGPITDIQVDRLAEGQDPTNLHPWMILQTTESRTGNTTRPAVQFFQPPSNADTLTKVYEFFSQLADEYSGIPPYAQGVNTSGGAAGTATGLSMLMNNAARGIKQAVAEIDSVIEPTIRRTFEQVMIHDDMPEIKGDLKIVARGSQALINREQQAVRRTELLQAMSNPMDMQIMGLEGRWQLLWDMMQDMDIDPHNILPDKDKLRGMMMQQQQQAQAQQQGPPQGRETMADGSVAGGADVQQPPRPAA